MNQTCLDFPQSLTEKYRPMRIAEFAGLATPKRILTRFADHPRLISFLFLGPSGTGKTTMALALANEIQAELHHIGSQESNLPTLQRICETCCYVPMAGKSFHLVLIDEADQISPPRSYTCFHGSIPQSRFRIPFSCLLPTKPTGCKIVSCLAQCVWNSPIMGYKPMPPHCSRESGLRRHLTLRLSTLPASSRKPAAMCGPP